MLSISEIKKTYNEIKQLPLNLTPMQEVTSNYDEAIYQTLTEYITSKFSETASIFKKLDSYAISQFCMESHYDIYEENQEIFKRDGDCLNYIFIIYGDINLYDEQFSESSSNNKLLKTLSAGSVYGHKLKLKFNYFAVAKNTTHMISIPKKIFDSIIEQTNRRKDEFKTMFLKKFFPKFRMYSEDLIKTLKDYFIREQYEKNAKIIVDNEFDEYVYLVIKGNLGVTKSIRRIKNLKENLHEINFPGSEHIKSVLVENLSRGDIFGVYSALKHHKNNFSVMVQSEKAEVYKISKSHCLYYFGGSSGVIPEALKGIDTVQEMSFSYKIDFLEKCKKINQLEKFHFICNENVSGSNIKKPIDESEIVNDIKDAWKSLENLGSKINDFKMNLLKTGGAKTNANEIFAKMKSQEETECNYILFYLLLF